MNEQKSVETIPRIYKQTSSGRRLEAKMASPTANEFRSPITSPHRTSSRQSSSSRQSITSSCFSLTTASDGSSVKSEKEPAFRSRWEDETEMDKSLKILKRKQAANVRLRKMNDVYNRQLEDKLRHLDSELSQISKELTKEKRFIQEEAEHEPPVLILPCIESATPVESRSASRLSGKSQTDKVCRSCLFDATNPKQRCLHFPCFLPITYNSIGFTTKPVTYSVVGNYHQLLQRCRDLRPSTSKTRQTTKAPEETIDEDSHAPRISVKEKIRGLKQLVKEMKERNEKTKPSDWAVNYGKPVPRRFILKPVKTV